ncbi:MAG: HAD family hydrolase [Treponema sp.]|jgi:phosphoglycolate phosphatase|nr:HAD family hydrolase [Treponema sp.]
MKYNCVIFDLDGTLADTVLDLAEAVNKTLEEHGFEPAALEDFVKMQGITLENQMLRVLPPGKRNKTLASELSAGVKKRYEELPVSRGKPYRGVQELLSALRRKRVKLAVLTNKPDEIANRELDRFFPAGSFDMVSGIRPDFPCKPDPAAVWELLAELDASPRNTILAGDSEIDMETARAAECLAVGVSWGYSDIEVLKKAGAQCIINKPSELMEFL